MSAYSESDLTGLKRALASGELRVKFSDGREVEYRSVPELQQAISAISKSVQTSSNSKPRVRQVKVNMEPGF